MQQQNLWFLMCSISFYLMVYVCVHVCVHVCVMHAHIPGQVFTFVTFLFIHLLGLMFFPPLRSAPQYCTPSSNRMFFTSSLQSVHEGKGGWDAVTSCGPDVKSRPEVDAWSIRSHVEDSICKLVWNAHGILNKKMYHTHKHAQIVQSNHAYHSLYFIFSSDDILIKDSKIQRQNEKIP